MKVNLVLQSYGNEREYKRAIFTVWSFFVYYQGPRDSANVIVFTDNVAFFQSMLENFPIHYVPLTAEKIKAMRGKIDFVHRVKIAVIEEAFRIVGSDHLLYVDSDTFFINDPIPFYSRLSESLSMMHAFEYRLKEMKELKLPAGKLFHTFYDFIDGKEFILTDGSKMVISPEQASWSAGVILLHASHQKLLPDVYRLTDALYPDTKHHGCEQYAFCIFLNRITRVETCEEMIYHYWLPVKKPIADEYFSMRITSEWATESEANRLASVKKWTQDLPAVFENHPRRLRDKAILAFNENHFNVGYGIALRALIKNPFHLEFIRDVLYHTRRLILGQTT
jgi:hypothetical protein